MQCRAEVVSRVGRAGQGGLGCGIRLGGAGIADVFRFCPGWKAAVHALIGRAGGLRLGWGPGSPVCPPMLTLSRVPCPGVCGLRARPSCFLGRIGGVQWSGSTV